MIQFAVSFILGIVFEKVFHLGWSVALLVCLISVTTFLFSRFSKIFLIIGLAFALGILRMSFINNSSDANLSKLIGQKISFEAIVSDEPDVRDASARYTTRPHGSKSLVLLVADRFPEFKYGDRIKVSGKLDLPKNFQNDNGTEFDYTSYLAKDKIHFLVYRPEIKKLESGGENKLVASLYALKNIFINKISNIVPEPNSSLIAGIIFGVKQSLGQELLDDFKKVGLIHIVVLSGYNITIIAAGVFWLTSVFAKRNLGFVFSVILILLFALMVGFSATVARAVIMALISILALYLGRPSDALRWLFIAGLFMLVWNPLLLFYDPSFQLSFMATLGLILFSEIIDKKFISQVIKLALKTGIPISFIVFFEKIKMREIISSTLAVQLFILPLLVKMSGFISVISFLINPLLLPLTPAVMAFGALTGAFGLLPFIGGILSWPFGAISYILTQIIIYLTEFSANLPLATFQTGSISLWFILVWYLAYGILFMKLRKNYFQSSAN
ncbi:MAG: ComEC/Rec2 family competence protein [Patescibacteria group bacterium]